jgi:isochorismate pyruvate lyase
MFSFQRTKVLLGIGLIWTSTCGFAKSLSVDEQAMQCSNIKCIRVHIDNIDDRILSLIAERTAYVRRAGIIKGQAQPANDKKRVREELADIEKKSIKQNIPVEISSVTFSALIQASIQYQQQYKDKYFTHKYQKEFE